MTSADEDGSFVVTLLLHDSWHTGMTVHWCAVKHLLAEEARSQPPLVALALGFLYTN